MTLLRILKFDVIDSRQQDSFIFIFSVLIYIDLSKKREIWGSACFFLTTGKEKTWKGPKIGN